MLAIQYALEPMRKRGGGAIVNISSVAGLGYAPHNSPEYSAGKAGLARLTATLAPTDGAVRTVQTEIDIEEPARGIEIRTFLGRTGTVAIRGAAITRAGTGAEEPCAKSGVRTN